VKTWWMLLRDISSAKTANPNSNPGNSTR